MNICPCGACIKPIEPGKCPICGTADLTYGREICQACAAAQIINARAGLT